MVAYQHLGSKVVVDWGEEGDEGGDNNLDRNEWVHSLCVHLFKPKRARGQCGVEVSLRERN